LLGLTSYFTGKPCLHGHISHRWVKSGNCYACSTIRRERRVTDLIEEYGLAMAQQKVRDENAESARVWRKNNLEKSQNYSREYYKLYRQTEHGKAVLARARKKYLAKKNDI